MEFDGGGALVLKKSKRISKKACLEFLSINMEWVLSHFKAMQDSVFFEDKMYYFGEWKDFNAVSIEAEQAGFMQTFCKRIQRLKESQNAQAESSVVCLQNLWLCAIKANDTRYKKILEAFYKEALKSYMSKRLEFIAKVMDLYPSAVTFGKSYRQLGCCFSLKKRIRFSLRLALMPRDCIDSVIIHELAHLKHQNHSRDFWNFVEKFDTNPKRVRLWLDAHRENLQIYYKVFKY
ncbi:DUF45 domain-containing protein [Helicobacter sp. MIT 11-5569]|uniref:M48 family metallopeptidase n=1 Tax=Helicobacter sp. MIT 11-5569 TaxID=1548151 RepID=UPI0010FEDB03|nr:YgjP-like metallopeptidase domain-containing protein [Helicobacter sp. MIT 11-5569]TLD84054.1 DUF45 domain-containing protein [Helicobacter sp. MIT 11-5569]